MNAPVPVPQVQALAAIPTRWPAAFATSLGALASFHLAWAFPQFGALVLVTLLCLCLLGNLGSDRKAFYGGVILGIAMYGPQLAFFQTIFGFTAGFLWLIVGIFTGLFLLLLRQCNLKFGPRWALLLTPILWTGGEYFRSELYYLRFSWLTSGLAYHALSGLPRLAFLGVYGLGLVSMAAAAMAARRHVAGYVMLALLAGLLYLPRPAAPPPPPGSLTLQVAGIQREWPNPEVAAGALDRLARAHPEAQLLVLSEYSFRDPVPEDVRDVVRRHHRYLIAGGIRRLPDGQFHNTCFVIGPNGEDVFEQGKSVPVQFMADGLPAEGQRVWDSPWGKIGLGVCYDLTYRRVMDELVRQGAQALIMPTMDSQTWGAYERTHLHGPFHPMRSAEYGIPTFGVWSSGVSMLTDRTGRTLATAPYPGQGAMLAGPMLVAGPGRLPWDTYVAPGCTVGAAAVVMGLLVVRVRIRKSGPGS